MDSRIIIHIKGVHFEIDKDKSCTGDFYLKSTNYGYNFEYVPNDITIFSELDLQPNQCRISFFLLEVNEIVYHEESLNTIILNFIFSKGMSFPYFRFSYFAQATVSHLLGFLSFKNAIQQFPTSSNRYQVVKPDNRNYQVIDNDEYISPKHLFYLVQHKQIIHNLKSTDLSSEEEPLTLDDCLTFFQENGICSHFENLKREVFRRGLTNEARCRVWPYLLGLSSPSKSTIENEKFLNRKLKEYQSIRKQWKSITESQQKEIPEIAELVRVVENDVKRTDRTLPQFQKDNSPNLVLLHNVLISYALYNHDTGYVQGMGDLVSPFIILYIKNWTDNDHAEFYDGKIVTRDEAESFMLWLLCGMMATMQHDRMFTELAPHQQFAMERAYEITKRTNPPLREWLVENELTELFFLYRPILLLFKREFDLSFVYRLWDSFFSHTKPFSFPRFFLAAVLMILFPRLMLHTKGGIGDVMSLTDRIIGSIDGYAALNIAIGLQERINASGKTTEWALAALPDKSEYRQYQSKYMST
ncbi:TBC domain containing protein [Tritrichomonas foetus]|uniref:TBC domain containing protein n=1 Tax=Tritrichomonas foetus TaxID=1144522 RepID=A0A1J4K1L7_9EUKA|nr:TBC domain containing protein [Tritrichomonas foetus]|eukprot:OHT05329.1 TBC domain containing protein [Tritrichomonas foetus]